MRAPLRRLHTCIEYVYKRFYENTEQGRHRGRSHADGLVLCTKRCGYRRKENKVQLWIFNYGLFDQAMKLGFTSCRSWRCLRRSASAPRRRPPAAAVRRSGAAITTPYGVTEEPWPVSIARPAVMVRVSGLEVMINGQSRSFQLPMKLNMPTVRMAGTAFGRMICAKMRNSPAPSMRAALSRSSEWR